MEESSSRFATDVRKVVPADAILYRDLNNSTIRVLNLRDRHAYILVMRKWSRYQIAVIHETFLWQIFINPPVIFPMRKRRRTHVGKKDTTYELATERYKNQIVCTRAI